MSIFKSKSQKILFVASEAMPYVKVGGLGEVMYALPKALRELGCDVRTMIPKYGTIDTEKYHLEPVINNIRLGGEDIDPSGILISNILKHNNNGGITYFLENMEYYEKRANVYGYSDDTVRWVILSKGILEFLKRSDWVPDVIVASDWQTGFVPNLIHTDYKDDPILSKITVVFSIHNLKFQGLFDPHYVSEMDFDSGQDKIPPFFNDQILKLSGMRRGIRYADVVSTVSPTYAKEILTEEFGETLDKILNERKSRLFGVLNGIDTSSFDPATDPDLVANFSVNNLSSRIDNKPALQTQFGLAIDPDKFIFSIVSRLDDQKGFDLTIQVMEQLMENLDFQIVLVGEGNSGYRQYFENLKEKYPDRVGVHFSFDSRLPRMIFAGADAILIPSKFEPSGLVQMEAMRYGCIPLVRKTGGLADSVSDYNPEGKNKGTGFVFEKYNSIAYTVAMVRAFQLYRQKKEWTKLMQRAMKQDFSWQKSAKEYIKLFNMAIRFHAENKPQ